MGYQKTYRIIKPKKWYIVDTYRPDVGGKPRMLKKEFDNKKQVIDNIKMIIGKKSVHKYRFDAIEGKEAIELGIYILNAFPNLRVYLRKYNYANYMVTPQDRKSYRTKFRRHNRNRRGDYNGRWG